MIRRRFTSAAVVFGLALITAGAVQAQFEPAARLGLSAVPDRYVDEIAPDIGAPFTLYVILTGLTVDEPLSFDLASVGWTIHTACCGDSPVGVTSLVYADGVIAIGDPYEQVETVTDECPGGETVLLATATFEWLLEGETEFLLSAGAQTGALDCTGDAHLLQTLTVTVEGQEATPVEQETWSSVKSLFSGAGGTP
jgi:hypothetical protein